MARKGEQCFGGEVSGNPTPVSVPLPMCAPPPPPTGFGRGKVRRSHGGGGRVERVGSSIVSACNENKEDYIFVGVFIYPS